MMTYFVFLEVVTKNIKIVTFPKFDYRITGVLLSITNWFVPTDSKSS